MRRKRAAAALLAAGLLLCASCQAREEAVSAAPVYSLATVFTQEIYAGDAAVLEQTPALLAALDAKYNRFSQTSELSAVNAAAGGAPVTVSEEMLGLLARAQEYAESTGGAFSPTLAPLTSLWDFEEKICPAPAAVEAALPQCDGSVLALDAAAGTAFLSQAGAGLDLGALVKGYAVERILEQYRVAGVTSALVSCGSSIGLVGTKPSGADFLIGVRDPDGGAGDFIATLALSDCLLSTSGDYERQFEADGVRYHHILDPATGWPARSGLRAVTVVGQDGAATDAFSTAAYVLGLTDGAAAVRAAGMEAVFVTEDGSICVTPGLEGKITVTDARYTLRVLSE